MNAVAAGYMNHNRHILFYFISDIFKEGSQDQWTSTALHKGPLELQALARSKLSIHLTVSKT